MTRLIATFLYAGYLRPAPGTWGSLAALPVAWVLHVLGGPVLLALGIIVAFASGWWATALETKGKDDQDPAEIVIDEVAGHWPGWVVAFLAFRLFDIWKPGPIGWADRRSGAMGVMLDDILAGVAAALCVMLGAWLAHGVFS